MIELVAAALGPAPGRVGLITPPPALVADLAKRAETLLILEPAPRKARRHAAARLPGETLILPLRASSDLPFAPASLDALVCHGSAPEREEIDRFRRALKPGGTLLLVCPVREGVAGGAASLVRRAARSRALPRAADLTAALLLAGMRPVRQAAVKRAVVPEVVTWAEVRPRPWER